MWSAWPSTWLGLLLVLASAGSTLAKPLNVSLTDCHSSGSSSSSAARITFSEGFAQLVDNVNGVLGPSGQTGNKLLRMNLVGTTSAALEGFDNTTNKLATLFTLTTVLSAPVVQSVSSLCYALNTNPATALPSENPTACTIAAGDVALNLTLPLKGSFPLTTLQTTIRIVDTAYPNPNELSCLTIAVTPYYPHSSYYSLILWLPAALAAAYWLLLWSARCLASWNAAVASDVGAVADAHGHHHHRRKKRSARVDRVWSRVFGTAVMSSASGDLLVSSPSLLRFVTPGFRDLLWHIQFCSVLAQIAVNWPVFVYPIASRGAWASLIGNVTLVQGAGASEKRLNLLDTHNAYSAPPTFARQFNDSASPLYLNPNAANVLLNMNADRGMESWANAVGLRGEDLFGTSAAIFCFICAALILLSLAVWTIHAVVEYAGERHASDERGVTTPPLSPGMFGAPLRDLDAVDAAPLPAESESVDKDGAPHVVTLPGDHAPGRLKRQWWKFGLKGSVGVFYASSLQGNLIRLLLLFHCPLTAFTVYHFFLSATTDACSVASMVLAAIFFAVVCVLAPVYCVWRLLTVPSSKLYDATRTLMALGPLYNLYGEGQQRYAAVLLASSLVTGIVVGAGQRSGTAQAAILIVLEIVMGLVTMIWLPWGEGASMGATTFLLGVLRTITLVLVLVLTPAVNIGTEASAWIAYAILVIQGIILLFYLLVLLVKLVEAVVRIIVHAPFDESTDEFDSGLLGAFSKASCCGEGLIRPSGRRRKGRRRPRGVGGGRRARHSTTASQQGMLDASQSSSLGKSAGSDAYGQYDGATPAGFEPQLGYFPPGPPNDPGYAQGFIMGGWRPPPTGPYGAPPADYLHMQQRGGAPVPVDGQPPADGSPQRSFSKVRGGKAAFETPYTVQPTSPTPVNDGSRSPGPNQPLLSARQSPALAPFPSSSSSSPHPAASPPPNARPTGHVRKKSETAVVDYANPPAHFYHSPGGQSMPSFSQAAYAAGVPPQRQQQLRQQQLTSAFGRAADDDDDDNDDDDDGYSDDSTDTKPRRRSWFLRNHQKGDISDSEDDSRGGRAAGAAGPSQSPSRWPFGRRSRPSSDSVKRGPEPALSPLPTAAPASEPAAPRSFSVVRPTRSQQHHTPSSSRGGSGGFVVGGRSPRGPNAAAAAGDDDDGGSHAPTPPS